MKLAYVIPFLALLTVNMYSQNTFPGLKSIMSEEEWKNSGLDKLSTEQISIINNAIINNQIQHPVHTEAAGNNNTDAAKQSGTSAALSNIFSTFGLRVVPKSDWQSQPALKAKVISWVSANQFLLDNQQVWEGTESIPYQLENKNIEIQARPLGNFALIVEGTNTTIRVIRIR